MKKLFIMALAAILIMSACGKEKLPPQTMTFTLESNPTTGFSWQVTQSEELFEVKSEFIPAENEENLVGVGGTELIVLTPLKAGKTEVTLTYAQPWEGGMEGQQIVYGITVDNDMQVTLTDAVGYNQDAPAVTPMPEIK